MVKPSIFSKDYKKRMRKRKRNIIVVIISVIAMVTLFFILPNFKNWAVKNIHFNKVDLSFLKKGTKAPIKKDTEPGTTTPSTTEESQGGKAAVTEEKSYMMNLSDGNQVKVIYEGAGTELKFKLADNNQHNVKYNINPSMKSIVVIDEAAQSMFLMQQDGSTIEITNTIYTSSSDKVFKKEEVLKDSSLPNYIWCSSPRFIDDNNIAYYSMLPWFKSDRLNYMWIYHVDSKRHQNVEAIAGLNITLGEVTPEGITVNADQRKYYLQSDGKFTQ